MWNQIYCIWKGVFENNICCFIITIVAQSQKNVENIIIYQQSFVGPYIVQQNWLSSQAY